MCVLYFASVEGSRVTVAGILRDSVSPDGRADLGADGFDLPSFMWILFGLGASGWSFPLAAVLSLSWI